MASVPRFPLLVALLLMFAGAVAAEDLKAPSPLISSFSLSTGWHYLDNDNYRDYFGQDRLPTWTLRYDHRLFRGLLLGVGASASGKSYLRSTVWAGEEHPVYPVHYTTTSFQYQWELGLRLQGPYLGPLASSASFSVLMSRVHVETTGYSSGYSAGWDDFRPAAEIQQNSTGTRASLGLSMRFWANVSLILESSLVSMDDYEAPSDAVPDVSVWNHSGWRTEIGLIQQF